MHSYIELRLTIVGISLIVQKPLCFVTLSEGSSVERWPQKATCPFFVRVKFTLDFPPITSSDVHVQDSSELSSLKLHSTSSRSVKLAATCVDILAAKDGLKMLLKAAILWWFTSRQTQQELKRWFRKRRVSVIIKRL